MQYAADLESSGTLLFFVKKIEKEELWKIFPYVSINGKFKERLNVGE